MRSRLRYIPNMPINYGWGDRYYQENNARYQAAVKRMGYTLSDAVLAGEHRAEFAPFIKQNGIVEEEQSVETHITTQANKSQE